MLGGANLLGGIEEHSCIGYADVISSVGTQFWSSDLSVNVVAATVNCAEKIGAKNLYIISAKGIKGRLIWLPSAYVGDMVMATAKKGKLDLRKKVMPVVIVRQRMSWRLFLCTWKV
ncbi:hypothetical protein M8C21_025739 [Ambrosia artemisiifolia]|uniref:Uncharacterized protein n=1 Tax=Ambrosia artemisiifolia TaxID=4212 RepID=A0AAD5DCB1_AMBAR|nr:hypothetical protein M8C21_025739 [Ambrosia artemisiifolia]